MPIVRDTTWPPFTTTTHGMLCTLNLNASLGFDSTPTLQPFARPWYTLAGGLRGGVAHVFDENGKFNTRCNTAMVSLDKVLDEKTQTAETPQALWHRGKSDEAQLKKLLEDHHRWTGSKRPRALPALHCPGSSCACFRRGAQWPYCRPGFWARVHRPYGDYTL